MAYTSFGLKLGLKNVTIVQIWSTEHRDGPKAGDADLWMKMWVELNTSKRTAQRDKKNM